jgi:hypothetical protein
MPDGGIAPLVSHVCEKNLRNEQTKVSTVQVFLKTLTGKTETLNVNLSGTVLDLKELIQEKTYIPIEHQKVVFAGRQLENERNVADYEIKKESTVHMVLRLRGGMYHASSGRIGDGSVNSQSNEEKILEHLLELLEELVKKD